jgi:hypothetical protein
MAGLYDFINQLPTVLPSVAVLGGAGWWFLQKHIENKLAQKLESTKQELQTELAKTLEVTKHELQLDYQRKSIVFEHQRDSFRRVLTAMHKVIEAIAGGPPDEWRPIRQDVLDEFRAMVSEECLLLDEGSDHALRLFIGASSKAVARGFEEDPTQEEMRQAHGVTTFLFERLADHFRARVGLVPEELDPVFDMRLPGACLLINRYHFSDHSFPTRGPLEFLENETAAELVATARMNLDLLQAELKRLRAALADREARSRDFFQAGIDAAKYLTTIGEWQSRDDVPKGGHVRTISAPD